MVSRKGIFLSNRSRSTPLSYKILTSLSALQQHISLSNYKTEILQGVYHELHFPSVPAPFPIPVPVSQIPPIPSSGVIPSVPPTTARRAVARSSTAVGDDDGGGWFVAEGS
jgi:hypothetical protein